MVYTAAIMVNRYSPKFFTPWWQITSNIVSWGVAFPHYVAGTQSLVKTVPVLGKGARRNLWISKHKTNCARSARENFAVTPILLLTTPTLDLAMGESSSENGETVVQQWDLSFFIVKM